MRKEREIESNLLMFLCNYKPNLSLAETIEGGLLMMYDLSKANNIMSYIVSVFNSIRYMNEKLDERVINKVQVRNKFMYILNLYEAIFSALDLNDKLYDMYEDCDGEEGYREIMDNIDEDILNYYLFVKVQIRALELREEDEEFFKDLLDIFEEHARYYINDKTKYNKIPKDFRKKLSDAIKANF